MASPRPGSRAAPRLNGSQGVHVAVAAQWTEGDLAVVDALIDDQERAYLERQQASAAALDRAQR